MSIKKHTILLLCQVTVVHYDHIHLDDGAYYACTNLLEFISGFCSRGGQTPSGKLSGGGGGGGGKYNPWEKRNPY